MPWWFPWRSGAPSRKESRSTRVMLLGLNRWADGLAALKHPQKYAKLTAEGYENNITVYRCINVRSRAGAGVPWVLYERGRARGTRPRKMMHSKAHARAWSMARHPNVRKALETVEIEDHEYLSLMERPNGEEGGRTLIANWIGYYALTGNSYLEILAPETGPRKGRPIELYQLRPDRMYIVPAAPGSGRKIERYDYRVNQTTQPQPYAPEEIAHNKNFAPLDDFYGLSPLQVAIRALQTDNTAAEWNNSLFDNQARPSGVLTVQDQLADDSYNRFRQQIDNMLESPDVRTRPLLLEGGAKWQQLGLSPVEIDFLQGRKFSRVELCAIEGVPPEMIGDADHKTFNSYPEARSAFYMETVLPDCDLIRDTLNNRVLPAFGDRLYVDYDRDQIEALQEDQNALWERVGKARQLSLNEQRAAIGYDTYDDDPRADVPLALLAPAPAAGVEPGSGNPAGDDGIDDDDDARARKMLAAVERKQQLTPQQEAIKRRLKLAMRKHFRGQGNALLAHMERGLEELTRE